MGSHSRKRFVLSGRVQGVGCRNQIQKRLAREFAAMVHGYVRNLEDGRVEVVVEGAPGDLAKVSALLELGLSAPVAVSSIEASDCPADEELSGFQIRS